MVAKAVQSGFTDTQIGEASFTTRMPPRPTTWQIDDPSEELDPSITLPSPPERQSAVRIAATTLASAVADASDNGHSYTTEDESTGLSPTTFETIVHRLNELRPPRREWEMSIRQLSQMNGEEPSDVDIQKVIHYAEDAIEFVNKTEANLSIEASHDEYSVVARLNESRIVGDIDHLLYCPGYVSHY